MSGRFPWRRRLVYVGVPVLLVLAGTFQAYLRAVRNGQEAVSRELDKQAKLCAVRFFESLSAYRQVTESITDFYHASQYVDRDEFALFIQRDLDIYPAIQALEWIPRVPRDQRRKMEQQAEADGLTGFRIRQFQPGPPPQWVAADADWAEEYYPVYYVEPLADNQAALGIDLASNEARRKALEAARDSGEPRSSSGIKLVQERGGDVGILYFVPVYTTKSVPPTVAERREALQGFSLGVFRVGEILRPFLEFQGTKWFHLEMVDLTDGEEGQTLYADRSGAEAGGARADATQYYVFGERNWRLEFFATPVFRAQVEHQLLRRPWLILLVGLAITVALGAFLNVTVHRSETVERLVHERTRELEHAEQRFKLVVESVGTGMLLADADGRITLVNAAAETMFGYTRAELTGQTVEILLPENLRARHVEHRRGYMEHPEQRAMGARPGLTACRKDGSEFPIEAELVPVHSQGKTAILVSVTDVTERKQAEADLAEAIDNLKRSNRELEQFAYVASHDLQEPLRAINSFSQLLAKNYQGKLDADADEFIGFIKEAAQRAQVLIHDLLAFSRVGTRGKPFASTDCNQVLDHALQNLQLAIEENHVTIERTSLPTVVADDVQLTQLFQNLINNAIKFRHADNHPQITIGVQPRDAQWEFSVRDNGIGIEPQYFDRIFIIFQRLHGREEYAGTGIGLAVCQKIVERHGGKIWVESQPGQGSTFKFTLPRTAEAAKVPAPPDELAAAATGKTT